MNNWNFKNETTKDFITGYEDVMDKLKEYTKERYLPLNEEDRAKMVNEVFNIYREKNIFPIYYYNENGIAKVMLNNKYNFIDVNGNLLSKQWFDSFGEAYDYLMKMVSL